MIEKVVEKSWEFIAQNCYPCCFDRKLVEDADAGIFTVTLFKSVISEFKAHAKIHK